MNRNEIINYLKSQKKYFQDHYHITSIGLFGSFARNEQSEESDIDLVYNLAENKKLTYYELFEFEQFLQGYFKRRVDLVNINFMNPIIKYKAEKDIIYV